jgi:hypothetical protein
MLKFIKDQLTENDNDTWCIARVSFVVTLASYIGQAAYSLYVDPLHVFHNTDFATGVMSICGGAAAFIGAKQFSGGK